MKKPSRIKALLLAVLVTIIWSTSWVLIKIGLADVPAMTFAGLRYVLASLLFFPILLKKEVRPSNGTSFSTNSPVLPSGTSSYA